MRFLCLVSIFVQVAVITACNRHGGGASLSAESERIELGQNVTVPGNREDSEFKDFAKNWRRFISTSPEIAAPVVGTVSREPAGAEPVIDSQCVFSPDAQGLVPQITISWNEPATAAAPPHGRTEAQAPAQVSRLRFDLGLHYNAFSRNYYSTGLSTEKLQRFSLPSNSALVNNPEAVILTGPGLFPRLMNFNTQIVEDRSNRRFEKQTIVLRDLNQGISYTMRVSRQAGKQWSAYRQIVFVVPVCPRSF
jgi:hypothetical protein